MSRKDAKLDAAAGKLHDAGKKVAGELGGKVGDAIANTILLPLRGDSDCNCSGRGHKH